MRHAPKWFASFASASSITAFCLEKQKRAKWRTSPNLPDQSLSPIERESHELQSSISPPRLHSDLATALVTLRDCPAAENHRSKDEQILHTSHTNFLISSGSTHENLDAVTTYGPVPTPIFGYGSDESS